MADRTHMPDGPPAKPKHFALYWKIKNNVNPNVPPCAIADGREGKLVIVDDREEMQFPMAFAFNIMEWWPLAQSNTVAGKLQRRIMRTNFVLPTIAAVAIALLSEFYTTTSAAGSSTIRQRLKYRSSPIIDFGICRGSVGPIRPADRLLFYSAGKQCFISGQDPDNHYWLYFTSLKGEEVFLDFSLHPFNFCNLVKTDKYAPSPYENSGPGHAPCLFTERELQKRGLSLYTERARMSILRNSDLQDVMKRDPARLTECDKEIFYDTIEQLSPKPLSDGEKDIVDVMLKAHSEVLGSILRTERWKRYPQEPEVCFDLDPGQKIPGLNA
ncbi:hypothetical protein BXZ70DRAFT_593398 [Cristinia sonorae]|uniref:Uncharacterized protein n=1 Tax=Cristinia sonorae TaxID=1940300 RepID=A0A8K0UVF4_9AGAR|nr:hypothetical protein BXZ70DRAFT_593398 [Cristinia sonorae]